MSKLVPLPNFYKIIEKNRKMNKPKETKTRKKNKTAPPTPELIESVQPRTFDSVVKIGTDCAEKVKNTLDTEEKLCLLKDGISDAVKELISIAFERAEVNDLISNESTFQHLQYFDPGAIFNADADSLQVAQVMSMISNLQETVTKLAVKQPSGLEEKMVTRIEKVKLVIEKLLLKSFGLGDPG